MTTLTFQIQDGVPELLSDWLTGRGVCAWYKKAREGELLDLGHCSLHSSSQILLCHVAVLVQDPPGVVVGVVLQQMKVGMSEDLGPSSCKI